MSRHAPDASPGRAVRWLLGAQVLIAGLLVLADVAPALPDLLRGTDAPALDAPVAPGDQTRRYAPRNPARPGPGIDPDMPRRLDAETRGGALILTGAIAPGDAERIVPQIARTAAARVALDSPGGSVDDALRIGAAIREAGLATTLAPGAVCYSACPYAFAGGTERTIAPDAALGVHQHAFGTSTILPAALAAQDIQRGQARVARHLEAMGIDLRLMAPALETPPSELYVLVRDELEDWRVVTD